MSASNSVYYLGHATREAARALIDLTIWPGFPTGYDATRHIDMWMLPVRDRVAIIGEYAAGAGAPHTITEAAVDELEGRGYTVLRTPGWRAWTPTPSPVTGRRTATRCSCTSTSTGCRAPACTSARR